MLQNLRDRTSGWLTWLIVVVICVMFALWGISYYLTDMGAGQNNVAKVNGVGISQTQFNQLYQQVSNQQNPQQPTPTAQLKQQTLNSLIKQQLLLQSAKQAGITITEAQIDQAIYQLPELQQNGKFSMQLYQQLLQNLNLTTNDLRQELSDNALINQYRIGVIVSDFALPNETNQFGALQTEQRSFGYAQISAGAFLKTVNIADQQIQQYYQAHLSDYMAPEQVKLSYLQLSLAQIEKNIKVADADAEAYYQQHLASFATPAQRQLSQITLNATDTATADKIAQALQQGKSFASLAQQYSTDPISAKKGGAIGWVKMGDIPGAFQDAAFALTKVGAVSAPVKTTYGLQIIELTGMKPLQQQSYAQVKNQVIQQLQAQAAKARFNKIGEDLANITYEHPDSLTAAAKELHLTIQTTEPFGKNGGKGIAANPQVIQAAFSDSVLTQANNSNVIMLDNTQAVVVRIAQDYPAHQLPLEAVKTKILATLQQQAANQAAQVLAQTVQQQLQKGAKPSSIAQQNHLTWVRVKSAQRTNKKVNASLLQAVFNQSLPGAAPVVGMVATDQGYAVFQLTSVTPGVVDAKSTQVYQYMLQNWFAQQTYQAYLAALQANAKIQTQAP